MVPRLAWLDQSCPSQPPAGIRENRLRVTTVDEGTNRPDAPILLVTKLHPPTVPAQIVARERLFARLRAGRGRRLSLVACPAGFGKSTLLAAWREEEARERPVAWVTLDEGDNDAVVLWSHVIEALGRACPALARDARRRSVAARRCSRWCCRGSSTRSPSSARSCSSSTTSTGSPARSTRESVAWFVDHMPATRPARARRPAPTRRSRSARCARTGQLLELRADELRFTGAEADEFLNGRLGLGLVAADVELLVARTEGWPAGIYLAALSLAGKRRQARPGRARSTARAPTSSTSSPARCSPPTRRSCSASCCARRCSSGCARRCATRCSASRLGARAGRAARSNLFLLPLDDRGGGSASTTCSPRSCASSWSAASPRSCRSCTGARSSGTARPARPTRRSTTRSRRARSRRPAS